MILASNFKSNIDEAFLRRFHSIIHFPLPTAQERLKLWKQSFPHSIPLNETVELQVLAETYEISGSSIINAVHYAFLKALSREVPILNHEDLINGIRKELSKEEK
jgi:SpoVK/Ycf46/Vps4 family AAA+-type ATPase